MSSKPSTKPKKSSRKKGSKSSINESTKSSESGGSKSSVSSKSSKKSVGGSSKSSKASSKSSLSGSPTSTNTKDDNKKSTERGPWQMALAKSKTKVKVRKDGSGVYTLEWGRPEKSTTSGKRPAGKPVTKTTTGMVRICSREPKYTPQIAGGLKKDSWGYGKITEFLDSGYKTYEVMGVQNKKPFFQTADGVEQVFITREVQSGSNGVNEIKTRKKSTEAKNSNSSIDSESSKNSKSKKKSTKARKSNSSIDSKSSKNSTSSINSKPKKKSTKNQKSRSNAKSEKNAEAELTTEDSTSGLSDKDKKKKVKKKGNSKSK